MLAGYETTSTALAYSMYVLATNQEEQARLRDVVDKYFPIDTNVILKLTKDWKTVITFLNLGMNLVS